MTDHRANTRQRPADGGVQKSLGGSNETLGESSGGWFKHF